MAEQYIPIRNNHLHFEPFRPRRTVITLASCCFSSVGNSHVFNNLHRQRSASMLNAVLILIACQFTGELLEKMLHLPVPGPVIGMFLLAAALILADGKGEHRGGPRGALERLSQTLISLMGLYFVPAGVGVITQAHLLRR